MELEWHSRIRKGNARGTGWLSASSAISDKLEVGKWYDLVLKKSGNRRLNLFLKCSYYRHRTGFYVPRAVCHEHSLLGKDVKTCATCSEYFQSRIDEDKRIRIPYSIVDSHDLEHEHVWNAEIIINEKSFVEPVLITVIARRSNKRRNEYTILVRFHQIETSTDAKVRFLCRLETVATIPEKHTPGLMYLPSLFSDATMAIMEPNCMVIFLGNHMPIVCPIRLPFDAIVHYMGCYFADGTKRGHGWSINASTAEQAEYYIQCYHSIIHNPKLVFGLVFSRFPSDLRCENDLRNELVSKWSSVDNVDLRFNRTHIRVCKSEAPRKWNENGSLRIRDNRHLVVLLHVCLLNATVDALAARRNTEQAWQMLFGILEGDGAVAGGSQRFGLSVATNTADEWVVRLILAILNLDHRVDRGRVTRGLGQGIAITIGLTTMVSQFDFFVKHVFQYYPKRRKRFVDRILELPMIQYLQGKKDTISNFTLKLIRDNGMDDPFIRDCLDKLEMEQGTWQH